jgi:excisionase family DNA binding protein
VRTVSLWAECGEIPAFKVGRQWRFRRESITKWIEAIERELFEIPLHPASRKQPVESGYRRNLISGAHAFRSAAR